MVPYECIVQDDKGQEYVYVLRDGYAVKQRLSVTKEWSGGIAVAQGVSAGDRVVYQPEGLSGDRVRVQVIS